MYSGSSKLLNSKQSLISKHFCETGRLFYNINYMLNSKHLSLVNKIGDKTEFTITRVHCNSVGWKKWNQPMVSASHHHLGWEAVTVSWLWWATPFLLHLLFVKIDRWNFVRFHKIPNHKDSENFKFLSFFILWPRAVSASSNIFSGTGCIFFQDLISRIYSVIT